MVYAAGVEPFSRRMVFHRPRIMTGTDLALSNSSAQMSIVATCAKTVERVYESGLDLKASPKSLTA